MQQGLINMLGEFGSAQSNVCAVLFQLLGSLKRQILDSHYTSNTTHVAYNRFPCAGLLSEWGFWLTLSMWWWFTLWLKYREVQESDILQLLPLHRVQGQIQHCSKARAHHEGSNNCFISINGTVKGTVLSLWAFTPVKWWNKPAMLYCMPTCITRLTILIFTTTSSATVLEGEAKCWRLISGFCSCISLSRDFLASYSTILYLMLCLEGQIIISENDR